MEYRQYHVLRSIALNMKNDVTDYDNIEVTANS